MTDKIFIDTNILIYAVSRNSPKCEVARKLLLENTERITVSSQVIGEFINICDKKNIMAQEQAFSYAEEFMEVFSLSGIKKNDIKSAMGIKKRYKYSYWDSLIIASALENNCAVLYTEDLQHDQIIEEKLRILNPFKTHFET